MYTIDRLKVTTVSFCPSPVRYVLVIKLNGKVFCEFADKVSEAEVKRVCDFLNNANAN